jgi:prepilin-type processing-associated H-X9-DG protein
VATLPSATNVALIQGGLLYPYLNQPKSYKCPGDVDNVNPAFQGLPTVRSYSMNCWMNPGQSPDENWNKTENYTGPPRAQVVYRKLGAVIPPTDRWVFIDENPYSINDGFFVCDSANPNYWTDIPASYHNGACGLSFADGHGEIHRWRDAKVLGYTTLSTASGTKTVADKSIGDLAWLQQRTTSMQ